MWFVQPKDGVELFCPQPLAGSDRRHSAPPSETGMSGIFTAERTPMPLSESFFPFLVFLEFLKFSPRCRRGSAKTVRHSCRSPPSWAPFRPRCQRRAALVAHGAAPAAPAGCQSSGSRNGSLDFWECIRHFVSSEQHFWIL